MGCPGLGGVQGQGLLNFSVCMKQKGSYICLFHENRTHQRGDTMAMV
jgi:hypothetical protein